MDEFMEKIKSVSNEDGLYEMHISITNPGGGHYTNVDKESYNGLISIVARELGKHEKPIDEYRFKWLYDGKFYDITFDMVEDYR